MAANLELAHNRDSDSEQESESKSDSEECDTDQDTSGPPNPKRSRKYSGAATYQTKFNPGWKKEFPFITSVSNDPYRYETNPHA